MKKQIQVAVKAPQYLVDTNVTFAQVNGWCGHQVKDLQMDIVYPEKAEKKVPCIIWICGGGWQQMSTSAHLAYLCQLARQGFAVASVQYRTSNEAIFPAQLEDVKAGIRYLRAHAERFCIDPERFGVMGESAGGHLSAMAALAKDKTFDKGDYLEYSSEVQAACTWYLPCSAARVSSRVPEYMRAASPESLLIGGHAQMDKEKMDYASPVNYVTEAAPPFLLLHGTSDRVVPFDQSEEMYELLEKAGADVQLIAIEGADHAGLEFFQEEVWEIIIQYFKEKL